MANMKTIRFRVEWGYEILYSRRHYHNLYIWDGHIEVSEGRLVQLWKIHYPVLIGGIPHSPKVTAVAGCSWQDSTRRRVSGLLVEAEIGDTSRIVLHTASGIFAFSVAELQKQGHLVFPVGPKYSNCTLRITKEHYLWFQPQAQPGQQIFTYRDFPNLELVNRNRMDCARLEAGESVELPVKLPPAQPGCGTQVLLHLQAMTIGLPEDAKPVPDESCVGGPQEVDADSEISASGTFPIEITRGDGTVLATVAHFFRWHGFWCQLLEDVWAEFPLADDACTIRLRNGHDRLPLLFHRAVLQRQTRKHLQLSLPQWLLKEELFYGRVWSEKCEKAVVKTNSGEEYSLDLQPGWNEFPLRAENAGPDWQVSVQSASGKNSGTVGVVYDLPEESVPVKVGADLTTVPHDDNGDMDYFLDYMHRTRMGNFAALRNFNPAPDIPAPSSLKRWGEMAAKYRFYLQYTQDFPAETKDSVNVDDAVEVACYCRSSRKTGDAELRESAGAWLHNAGPHESAGVVYALDPDNVSKDMKEATERFLQFAAGIASTIHAHGMRAGLGDASGAQHLLYEAGFDFLRSETMVPHTMLLCSQSRGAARAHNRSEWGVHIAMQHSKWPFIKEHHLGQYWLSLYQPWMMDASVFYEEDSLCLMFKEERQGWDDALTRGKRQITRDFFHFAKSHPRQGRSLPSIAVIEGRYGAPFNGFVCGPEQDPDYSVWGKFGRTDECWGHRQPEKLYQVLDVLMPGANTHPLRQDPDRRRFFFSGTPFGDFDRMPVSAPQNCWHDHKLAVLWGWNTMIPEDYAKLLEFVQQGGTLLTGLAQFNTSARREILYDVSQMPLWRDGDLSELAGFKVTGAGAEYSGKFHFLTPGFEQRPQLSRIPSRSPEEDGICPVGKIELCGAEPVAVDNVTGEVLLLRYHIGKGQVWCLNTFAFAGHEKLSDFASTVLAGLAKQNLSACSIQDDSGEIFWTWRPISSGCGQLMALNTDWTDFGHVRSVIVRTPATVFSANVVSGRPLILTVLPDCVIEFLDAEIPHIELRPDGSCFITASRPEVRFLIHRKESSSIKTLSVTPGIPARLSLNMSV